MAKVETTSLPAIRPKDTDKATLAAWDHEMKALIKHATKLLSRVRSKITTDEMEEQVNKGIQVAWARYLAAGDSRTAWQAATAWKVFLEAWRLIEGKPTAITEDRRVERWELLQQVQAVLQARHGPLSNDHETPCDQVS